MLGSVLALAALHVGFCEYTESLYVRPLSRGHALANFDFEMSQDLGPAPVDGSDGTGFADVHTYTTFPRSLGQIVSQSHTQELHLRFGQGWWDAEGWNAPPQNGALTGGIGVELWAWIAGEDEEDAWRNWRRLTHSLGGYFCASVNFVDETVTTFPSEMIHQPWGRISNDKDGKGQRTWLMRGALPAEPICTENLTPFLKLLPCKGKAGISSLLDGHSLFKSRWQTMSVDVWRSQDRKISLKQTVSNVMNTATCEDSALPWSVKKEELICDDSKPWSNDWTCFPVVPKKASYSLSAMFGKQIEGKCPSASRSKIIVDAPDNWQVDDQTDVREYDLNTVFAEKNLTTLDVLFSTEDSTVVSHTRDPSLYLDRSFSGWGQQRGGIRTVFTNPGNKALEVAYLESLPWFMRVYLHTTQLSGRGEVLRRKYVPGKDRGRPTQLETVILLPANARFEIEYSFDKSLLFIEEYPPDANHGFEVPPGLAIARPAVKEARTYNRERYEVRTSSLLLSLPVPDFSMPYNVIILTSTVMAMAFATLFNLMSRDVVSEDQARLHVSPLAKLKQKLAMLLGK